MYEDLVAFTPHVTHNPFSIQMSGISYCDGSYQIIRPKSSLYCFEYILKGTGYVRLNQTTFTAKAGDIYILPAGEDHYYYSDSQDPWTKIWFNISGDLVGKLLESYQINHVFHMEGLDLSVLFHDFWETAKSTLPQEQIFNQCAGILLKIIQSISGFIHSTAEDSTPALARELKKQIDDLTDFSISFETLINRLFCTKSHAIRVFKTAYGITPYRYLLQKKLSLSKIMLESTQLSIKEIASALGFHDNHYFSAFFKGQTGLSPQNYREKHLHAFRST